MFGRFRSLTVDFKFEHAKVDPWAMLPRSYLRVSQTPNFITEFPYNIDSYIDSFDKGMSVMFDELCGIEKLDPAFVARMKILLGYEEDDDPGYSE